MAKCKVCVRPSRWLWRSRKSENYCSLRCRARDMAGKDFLTGIIILIFVAVVTAIIGVIPLLTTLLFLFALVMLVMGIVEAIIRSQTDYYQLIQESQASADRVLDVETKRCPGCGNRVNPGAKRCISCGIALNVDKHNGTFSFDKEASGRSRE
ncbi:MAG: hypothetical protein ACE5OZ_08970 [Candidatus Heimdallarchaeota archaeon]